MKYLEARLQEYYTSTAGRGRSQLVGLGRGLSAAAVQLFIKHSELQRSLWTLVDPSAPAKLALIIWQDPDPPHECLHAYFSRQLEAAVSARAAHYKLKIDFYLQGSASAALPQFGSSITLAKQPDGQFTCRTKPTTQEP